MVVKINQPSTPFTASEWYEYYFKKTKKNTKQICILRKCFKHFELNYPFLDESQLWGKVYQLLGIPHICGKVNKSKLRDIYLKERKNKFNRLNRLNVDVKKIEKKGNKDYRAIIRRNRIINKPKVYDDQKHSDLENKKNNIIDNYELNSNTDGNKNNSAVSKKKVRFTNVRVLCYDKPTSSESDTEYSPSILNRKQKMLYNKNEIHEPYFEKLNDSQSITSASDNEGNDHDTGITSFSSSEDGQENSQVENDSPTGIDQENINECSQDNIVPENISISETLDQPLNESEEILSDIVENDYDTGIMSPLPCSMENINENSSDNKIVNIRLSNSSNEKENFTLSNSSVEEEDDDDEEILNSQGDQIEYREIKIARENAKRKPQVLTDLNEKENINTEHISITTHVTDLEEPSLTDLKIKTTPEEQNSKEISCSIQQKTKDTIENENSVKLTNKFSSKKPNEKSSLITDDDNDDFHEQYLTDSSHTDAEQLVTFIPTGNLVYQNIDHLEDYNLCSFSSNDSIGTSLLQKYLGFGNISTNTNIEYSADEKIKDQNSKNDSIVTDSPVGGQKMLSSLEANIQPNDKENQNRSGINTTNSNESLKTKPNSPKISLDSNRENPRDYLDSSPEVISNTQSSVSEQADKNKASKKREPLKLLSDNSLLNRLSNRKLKNEAFKDKENKMLTLTNQSLKTKNHNLQNIEENVKTMPNIVPNQPIHDKNNSSGSEILPPSNNTDKADEANILQEIIRSKYRNKFQVGINKLKESKEKEILDNIRDENLSFNSDISLISEDKQVVTKSDRNMSTEMSVNMIRSKEVQEDVTNKDNSINSVGSLPTEKVSHDNSDSQENINSQNQPITNQEEEANILQEKIRSVYRNKFQVGINILKDSKEKEILGSIRNENLSRNSDVSLFPEGNKIIVTKSNNQQQINPSVKRHSTRVFIERETLEGNDNGSLQLQEKCWVGNIFQKGNDKLESDYKDCREPESTELYPRIRSVSLTHSREENQDFDKENKAPNQLRRKTTETEENLFSDHEENYADSSSNDNNESAELLHKKVKRRKKKPTGISRIKNISFDNDKSPDVTSDDMELIQEIQDDNKKFRMETIPTKKTTTTTKIMIRQNVREVNDSRSTDDTNNVEEFSGGQLTTQQSVMKRKTSVVKQQICNVSSDTSTTSEFVSSALARRIFYLNNT